MAWLETILSPIAMAFVAVVIGCYVGKLRIFNISLGSAAVLLTAVNVGWLFSSIGFGTSKQYVTNIATQMSLISSLGTALFISTIGITAGYTINSQSRKAWVTAGIGCGMGIAGLLTMWLLSVLDTSFSFSLLLGVFCGALTTTPGLSAACELGNVLTEEVVLGYGSAYIVGVFLTIFFVQFVADREKSISFTTGQNPTDENDKGGQNPLVLIGVAIIFGNIFGAIKIPWFRFSLGSSGGMLCSSLLLGYSLQRQHLFKRPSVQELSQYKNFGLALFFVGNGIPAGIKMQSDLSVKAVIYAGIITVSTLLVGYVLAMALKKRLSVTVSSVIAGGMTSTPAIGVLVEKGQGVSLSQYSYAYLGALLTIIVGIRLLE